MPEAVQDSKTGRKAGPGLFEILSPIGASIVVDRLRAFAEREAH